ncbi:MAG: class I SAM-dependent methyltransferase [Thermoproteus sp. AZ2]|uniref:Class I SAM-dependent methyltransferase n=1 Tax=Thermoproteus sp. AZ2 TaxID=1609232 RepID=A0ACC6UYY5_9CREN
MATRDLFDEFAHRYDSWYKRHEGLYASELAAASLLGCRGGVEIGVGTGKFAEPLGLRAGLDPSLGMLRLAPKSLDLVLAVGEAAPFRDKAFPCALIVVTLCFADRPEELIREAARVAERVVACIVPRDSPWGVKYRREGEAGHVFYSRAKFLSAAEVVEMGRRAGLRLARISASLPLIGEAYQEPRLVGLEEAEKYGFVCLEFNRAV